MSQKFLCNRCSQEHTGLSPCVRCGSSEFRIQESSTDGQESPHQEGRKKGRTKKGS